MLYIGRRYQKSTAAARLQSGTCETFSELVHTPAAYHQLSCVVPIKHKRQQRAIRVGGAVCLTMRMCKTTRGLVLQMRSECARGGTCDKHFVQCACSAYVRYILGCGGLRTTTLGRTRCRWGVIIMGSGCQAGARCVYVCLCVDLNEPCRHSSI